MKLIIRQLTAIILAIASVAMLCLAVPAFRAPIGDFFGTMIGKQTTVGNDVLASINASDFNPGAGGEDDEDLNLTPALYDANDNILAHWETLVNDYGLDVEKDYVNSLSCGIDDIISNNAELSTGVKLVIGNGVTQIGDYAFQDCTKLTSIIMPNSLTKIGTCSFAGCSNLQKTTIPGSVESVGSNAFTYCESLQTAKISNGVKILEGAVFARCTSLKSITIPDSVTDIENGAFSKCASLETAVIGNGVTSTGGFLFMDCTSLKNVTIGSSMKTIRSATFSGCNSLKKITIPKNITTIESSVFGRCYALSSVIFENTTNWKAGTTSVDVTNPATNAWYLTDGKEGSYCNRHWTCGEDVFDDQPIQIVACGNQCVATAYLSGTLVVSGKGEMTGTPFDIVNDPYVLGLVKSIVISDGVTRISSFRDYPNLTNVTIPESVVEIGAGAFENCPSLTSVTFENTDNWNAGTTSVDVTDPATNATNLKSTYVSKTWTCGYIVDPDADIYASGTCGDGLTWELTNGGTFTFSGPGKKLEFSSAADIPWIKTAGLNNKIKKVIIADGITSISSIYLKYCHNLESVIISNSVTSIGSNAFSDCSSLKSISISESVVKIGTGAFNGCSSLESITIPASVTSIGTNAFNKCTSLTSVTFENSSAGWKAGSTAVDVTNPGTNATYLTDTYCGSSWSWAWTDPNAVASGTCGDNATWALNVESSTLTISGTGAMDDYLNPDTMDFVDTPWKPYLTSIKKVVIGNGITYIGNAAFFNCTSLKNVAIADTVTSIGDSAFAYCSSLESVKIPNSVTKIVMYAFQDCTSLESVTFENTSGWTAGGEAIDVTDPANVASNILPNYYFMDWTRS